MGRFSELLRQAKRGHVGGLDVAVFEDADGNEGFLATAPGHEPEPELHRIFKTAPSPEDLAREAIRKAMSGTLDRELVARTFDRIKKAAADTELKLTLARGLLQYLEQIVEANEDDRELVEQLKAGLTAYLRDDPGALQVRKSDDTDAVGKVIGTGYTRALNKRMRGALSRIGAKREERLELWKDVDRKWRAYDVAADRALGRPVKEDEDLKKAKREAIWSGAFRSRMRASR